MERKIPLTTLKLLSSKMGLRKKSKKLEVSSRQNKFEIQSNGDNSDKLTKYIKVIDNYSIIYYLSD